MDFVDDQLIVGGSVTLDVDDRSFSFGSDGGAHGVDGDQLAAAFAAFDDAADAEGMAEHGDRIADLVAGGSMGKHVIDDHIIRALERPSGEEDKGLEGVVALIVDAVKDLDSAGHGEVGNDGGSDGDMGQAGEEFGEFRGHRSAAHAIHEAGIGRADHQVGADPVGSLFLVVEHTHEDGHDGEDHDDFDGHGKDADDGAQGPVQKIGKDELIHFWEALRPGFEDSGTLISRVSAICRCTYRSGRMQIPGAHGPTILGAVLRVEEVVLGIGSARFYA